MIFWKLFVFNAIFLSRRWSTVIVEVWNWIEFGMEVLLWFFGIVNCLRARLTCVVFVGRLMIIFVFFIWRSKLVCCWTVLCENGDFRDGRGIGNRLDGKWLFIGICKVVLVVLLRVCKWIREERFLRKVLFFCFCFVLNRRLRFYL